MKLYPTLLLLACATFLSSCATNYKSINPQQHNYTFSTEKDSILMEYRYDLLRGKYRKKEKKSDVSLVAVKITNYSDRDLTFGRDIRISNNTGHELYLLDPEIVFKNLKQRPARYLTFLLFGLARFEVVQVNGDRDEIKNAGLFLGASLATANMLMASSSNSTFKTELTNYNLNGVSIKKGETAYGLVGLGTDIYSPLTLSVKTKAILEGN